MLKKKLMHGMQISEVIRILVLVRSHLHTCRLGGQGVRRNPPPPHLLLSLWD